ncbi:MAG: hypothetical protein LBQ79_08200 [Deltaproteobacteria bacterium]|nr:hypothetical protein [Deltaproteobacteria bacterium]
MDIVQGADVGELKATIPRWYDGYNWLGAEHVLNPHSILNFFNTKRMRTYWPLTGKSSHITLLALERPLDFMNPKLDSNLSSQMTMSELGNIDSTAKTTPPPT